MRKLLMTLLSAAIFAASATTFAQGQVRIGTTGGYAPFTAQNAAGQWEGFDIDVVMEACKRIQTQCTIIQNPWEGIIPSLIAKRFDVIISGMSINDERRQKIDFTRAYADTPAWFVAKKDSLLQSAKSFGDVKLALNGKSLGMTTGSIFERFGNVNLPGTHLRFYSNQETMNLDLATGRLDAVMQDAAALQKFIKSKEGEKFQQFGPGLTGADFPMLGEGLGMGVRKDDPELTKKLSTAVLGMRQDGTIRTLSMKWVGYDMTPKH